MNLETIEEKTRQNIASFLPDAIGQALKSYYKFSQQPAPSEAKEFSAHHNACKVAIAHIELLIKLAKWADLPSADAKDHNSQMILAAMMQQAQEELESFQRQEKTTKKGK